MTASSSLVLFLFAIIPFVASHGFVKEVTIDGTSYQGNLPGGTTSPSIIRQISTIGPVQPATNPSINCGMNATLASLVASANPGSQLQIHWVGSSDGTSNWPHETGPIMAYMAECVNTTCDKYDSTNAEWFKINELGMDGSIWYQTLISQGAWANLTLPSNIAPGNYLLRHELISLQNAGSIGGAEFYPSCTQLKIGGSQNGVAPSDDLCTFPGGYNETAPGIYDPDVYNPGSTYVFPGPPVATLVAPGTSSPAPNSTSTPTQAPNPTSTSSGNSASCQLQPSNNLNLRRRHLSKFKRHLF
ncbi:glycoside hydrolase family 61 protein [Serpula lacrymans var. lacrymans S7.3]|uniref:lytic cellulose monooxygenase (C4-dehydrogenating) n=1 Tax=Serpula lacrymans var. lacrymans (strain S7.3) TaxID=936435 RepID=F8QBR8_SERL3|nr:glycoside hydrolase family 61 protein [Serpula lacrymans var. lacrymans S7.3]